VQKSAVDEVGWEQLELVATNEILAKKKMDGQIQSQESLKTNADL